MSNTVISKSGDEVAAEEEQAGNSQVAETGINIMDLPKELFGIILRHLAMMDYYALYDLGKTSMFFKELCDEFIENNPKEEFGWEDHDSDDDYSSQIDLDDSYSEDSNYTLSINSLGHVYEHYEGQPHYVDSDGY